MSWPTDDLIEDQIKECHGVLGVVAERLGCNYEQLTMHVGKSSHLAYVLQRSSTSAVDDATFFLRHGCKAGDMASIALYLKKIKDDREAGGGGNGLSGQTIDFTKEVESVHDLTDAEIRAIILRGIAGCAVPGERCPCCNQKVSGATTPPEDIATV